MKSKYSFSFVAFFGLLILIISDFSYTQSLKLFTKDFQFSKTQSSQNLLIRDRKTIDVNRISAWLSNDGEFFSTSALTGPGFEWPKGSGLHTIFSAGLWLGAKIQDSVRVATAGYYYSEYRPGMIINNAADDFTKPEYRVYKVRPTHDTPGSNPDFAEWPVAQGAPFHDIDDNGIYNPYIDRPALVWGSDIIYPEMLMYSVFNDANSKFHTSPWGRSKTLGAEVRQTTWAFSRSSYFLDNTIFMRFEIINKSSITWDSTYIALWSDPDVGDPSDDLVGVDTGDYAFKNNLSFSYNKDNYDASYGYAPPAIGTQILQGPAVYTGSQDDNALWSGRKLIGYKNLDASSFSYFCNLNSNGCSADLTDPQDYIETYNTLKGLKRTGQPYYDNYGNPTKFPLVWPSKPGWPPPIPPPEPATDPRMAYKVGPFTLAPGDTQPVVYAFIVGRGTTNINSVEFLRSISNDAGAIYRNNFKFLSSEMIIDYRTPDSTDIILRVNEPLVSSIMVSIYRDYIERDSLLMSIQLFDNGSHWDGSSNDGIWGNKFTLPPKMTPYGYDIDINYQGGSSLLLKYWYISNTVGPLEVISYEVGADNINQNGKINPGENVRLTFNIRNGSKFYIDSSEIYVHPIENQYIFSSGRVIPVNVNLSPFCTYQKPYNPLDSSSYVSFDVSPSTPIGYTFEAIIDIQQGCNYWRDTVSIVVEDYQFPPRLEYTEHTNGIAEGAFGIRLVDYLAIRDNDYQITISKSPFGETLFNLINITRGDSLLKSHTLPELLGHNIPITEGFRITRGNITTTKGVKTGTYIPSSNRWFSGPTPLYGADVKDLGIYYPRLTNFIGGKSAVDIEDLRTVEIRFSSSHTQKAYRYIAGFQIRPPIGIIDSSFVPFVLKKDGYGFIYQDYERFPLGNPLFGRTVPFTVWERDPKTGAERQLNIAIIERNDTLYDSSGRYVGKGKIDGKWFPTTHSTGGSEFLYIFSSTYNEDADTFYTTRNLNNDHAQFDIYYTIWPRLLDSSAIFTDGDTLRIVPYFPLKINDVFTFNPMRLLDVKEEPSIPHSFKLDQNYPNPFNSTTNIKYQISNSGIVSLKVYNILGQEVKTLVNEIQDAGYKEVNWGAKNNLEQPVASGVYFYRIVVREKDFPARISYIETKKMVLIR